MRYIYLIKYNTVFFLGDSFEHGLEFLELGDTRDTVFSSEKGRFGGGVTLSGINHHIGHMQAEHYSVI